MSARKGIRTLVAITTAMVLFSSSAYALRGKINSATGIAFAATYPEHARTQVQEALQHKGCKFIDGQFINSVSTLHFSGDTASLNELARKLTECPGTTVAVSFKKIDVECDWQLVHDAHSNAFQIMVNLNSNDVHLEDLVIPAAKGPRLER